MMFKKGNQINKGRSPWNKGKKGVQNHSKEFKEKMSERMNGNTRGFKKGFIPWNKGKKQWESKKHPMLGKKHTEKTQIKMSKGLKKAWKENKFENRLPRKDLFGNHFRKGQKPWNYIDGRSKNCSPARYGDDWEAIRLLVYVRDKFTCQECGEKMSKFPFHIHHKIPFLISFNNSLNNLITLCPPCHRREEARIMKKIKQGVIIQW